MILIGLMYIATIAVGAYSGWQFIHGKHLEAIYLILAAIALGKLADDTNPLSSKNRNK